MSRKFLSADEFRGAARRNDVSGAAVYRLADSSAVQVGDRALRFCFSDGSIDRAGDKINPQGWQLDEFLPNPIALWAHMSMEPPIGRGKNVGVVGGRLIGDIEFARAETYAFADTIFRLCKDGFIKAVSVGFVPLEWSFSTDKDRPLGIDFKKQSLLEISVCAIPCNPNALMEARAKGIDTRPLLRWLKEAGGQFADSPKDIAHVWDVAERRASY